MEAVVLAGIQASGKSTFFRERFFETHVRIGQDLLRTRNRQERFLALCLETRQPFVVDRVNHTAERARFVVPARRAGFRVVAYWFDTRPRDAIDRNARRTGRTRVPVPAVLGTYKRFAPPQPAEGFDAVHRVVVDPEAGFMVDAATDAPATG